MNHSIENKTKLSLVFLFAILAYFNSNATASAQVRVLEGTVSESRRNDGFSSSLQVKLKAVGDPLKEAKAIRVIVERAMDETGKNLIDEKKVDSDFKGINLSGDNNTEVSLDLKSSDRKAAVIKEIAGRFELFNPAKDPKSFITVTNVIKTAGKPVSNPVLKSAGIEVTVWTKEQYEVRKKAEEERIRKEQEEKRKKGGTQALEDLGEMMVAGLSAIFGGLSDGFDNLSDNSVVFTIKDPNNKLLHIEFQDEKGDPIKFGGSSSSGNQEVTTRIFDLDDKLPASARVRLALLTPASIIKVPFRLVNVPLP